MKEMTREELQHEWVQALRSGKYERGTGALRCGNRYCCLGVAAEIILGQGCWVSAGTADGQYQLPSGDGSLLPIRLAEKLLGGAGCYTQEQLAELNDLGATFADIADLIESDFDPEVLYAIGESRGVVKRGVE